MSERGRNKSSQVKVKLQDLKITILTFFLKMGTTACNTMLRLIFHLGTGVVYIKSAHLTATSMVYRFRSQA